MPSIECHFNNVLIIFNLINQRIGYLAASQSFHENTEVMMLTTNMIRKVGLIPNDSNMKTVFEEKVY
jgi:hypothetical protein